MMFPSFAAAGQQDGLFEDPNSLEKVFVTEKTEDGGEIVRHKDPSATVPENSRAGKIGAAIPSSYDLRTQGLVTPVKNQGDYNFCWAYASIASMESNLLKKGLAGSNIDLSETHLAYYTFHGRNTQALSRFAGRDSFLDVANGFSNYYCSGSTLARRYGAVNEAIMPYSAYRNSSYHNRKIQIKRQFVMTDMLLLETANSAATLDWKGIRNVQRMIMENGAVASLICSYGGSYKTDYPASGELFYSSNVKTPDHAITIVGWNDEYECWLAKNSYGTGFPYDRGGYFWVSYHSPSVNQFYSFRAAKNDHRQMYQYDGTGFGDFAEVVYARKNVKVRAANTFKARKDVRIDQTGVWTLAADTRVNIRIYVTKNGSSPAAGRKMFDKTIKVPNSGYHTLPLGKSIGVPKGAKFSVVITEKRNGIYLLPVEVVSPFNNTKDVTLNRLGSGQSYLYFNKKWYDLKKNQRLDYDLTAYNAVVKALGKNAGVKGQKIKVKSKRVMRRGSKLNLKAKIKKGGSRLYYQTSNSKKATVSAKGIVKAKKRGQVKITVWAAPTWKYKSAKKTVKIRIK